MGQWTTGIERDIQRDSEAFDASEEAGWICSDCGKAECECPEDIRYQDDAHAEWMAEAALAQWDDGPSPYHGDYSEM